MFNYRKADQDGGVKRMIIHLRQVEAIILLLTRGSNLSPITEATCLDTRLHPLPRDGQCIQTVAMASETVMGRSTTMRNSELVLTWRQAMMTGVPVPSLHHLHLRHWLENVSEWCPLNHTSGGRHSPLLLRPT